MKIDNLDHSLNLGGSEKKRLSLVRKNQTGKRDSVEISSKAKALQDQNIKTSQASKDKDIDQIRAKLNLGLYERHEYKEKTANKLVESQELKDIVYNSESLKGTDLPKDKIDKIQEIKHKLATGFYNRADILDKIAEKLVKEFGFK